MLFVKKNLIAIALTSFYIMTTAHAIPKNWVKNTISAESIVKNINNGNRSYDDTIVQFQNHLNHTFMELEQRFEYISPKYFISFQKKQDEILLAIISALHQINDVSPISLLENALGLHSETTKYNKKVDFIQIRNFLQSFEIISIKEISKIKFVALYFLTLPPAFVGEEFKEDLQIEILKMLAKKAQMAMGHYLFAQRRVLAAFTSLSPYFNQELFINEFAGIMESVEITRRSLRLGLRSYYLSLLDSWLENPVADKTFGRNQLKSLLAISKFDSPGNSISREEIITLDKFNRFLARDDILFDIDRDTFIELVDRRWNLLESLLDRVRHHPSIATPGPDFVANLHPQTKIYVAKALLRSYPEEFLRYKSSLSISKEQIQARQFVSLKKEYIHNILLVDYYKYKLEENASTKTKGEASDLIYQKLADALENALAFRRRIYEFEIGTLKSDHSNTFREINKENPKTNDQARINMCLLSEIDDKCPPMIIPAGIYNVDEDTIIEGGVIKFHPLAMIKASGKSVEIRATELSSLWIDVSSPPVDNVLKKSFYPYHTNPLPLQGNSSSEGWIDFHGQSREFWSKSRRQSSGHDGGNAGKIQIKVGTISGNPPILWASGGPGGEGVDGHDSRAYHFDFLKFHLWKTKCEIKPDKKCKTELQCH